MKVDIAKVKASPNVFIPADKKQQTCMNFYQQSTKNFNGQYH